MRIQSLAIIFIIIILPISIVLASSIRNKVDTLSMQATYDSKLNDATYDAIKAYQLNSLNSDMSSYTNSKMRDIKASVNVFFNSLSSNYSSIGYSKETIQNYVPALVYTMYDGYYIYSKYNNTWDNETRERVNDIIDKETEAGRTATGDRTFVFDPTYHENEELYGLKPYVYYSCRYKDANFPNRYDVVITYSLDNYIQIQGKIKDSGGSWKTISISGYLINGDSIDVSRYNADNPNLFDNLIRYKPTDSSLTLDIKSERLYERIAVRDYDHRRNKNSKCFMLKKRRN